MKKVTIPPVVSDIIISGISSLEDFLFDEAEKCPFCGGELKGHDTKRKKFATIYEKGCKKNIMVNVKRFRCCKCKRLVYANSPFYENIRIGSPIVDFCAINLRMHPANHISKILKQMNILVNPATIRKFSGLDSEEIPYIELLGIFFPFSIVNLSENIRNEKNTNINPIMLHMMQRKRN